MAGPARTTRSGCSGTGGGASFSSRGAQLPLRTTDRIDDAGSALGRRGIVSLGQQRVLVGLVAHSVCAITVPCPTFTRPVGPSAAQIPELNLGDAGAIRGGGGALDGDDDDLAADSLLRLAGLDFLTGSGGEAVASRSSVAPVFAAPDPPIWSLTLSGKPAQVDINGLGAVKGVSALVLKTLAAPHLAAAGAGRAFEDYPLTNAADLSADWGVDEEGVRKRITRLRRRLDELAIEAGQDPPDENAIIETIPRRGYRLAPEGVRVFMARRQ
jgi:hypothetical protein